MNSGMDDVSVHIRKAQQRHARQDGVVSKRTFRSRFGEYHRGVHIAGTSVIYKVLITQPLGAQ